MQSEIHLSNSAKPQVIVLLQVSPSSGSGELWSSLCRVEEGTLETPGVSFVGCSVEKGEGWAGVAGAQKHKPRPAVLVQKKHPDPNPLSLHPFAASTF